MVGPALFAHDFLPQSCLSDLRNQFVRTLSRSRAEDLSASDLHLRTAANYPAGEARAAMSAA